MRSHKQIFSLCNGISQTDKCINKTGGRTPEGRYRLLSYISTFLQMLVGASIARPLPPFRTAVTDGQWPPLQYYGACYVFDENGVFVEHIGSISSDYVDTLESKYFTDNT